MSNTLLRWCEKFILYIEDLEKKRLKGFLEEEGVDSLYALAEKEGLARSISIWEMILYQVR